VPTRFLTEHPSPRVSERIWAAFAGERVFGRRGEADGGGAAVAAVRRSGRWRGEVVDGRLGT